MTPVLKAQRNDTIERCAQVAESTTYMSGAHIAAAIRKLKDEGLMIRQMDIVESLRRAAAQPGCSNALAQEEAANEIERLRKQLDGRHKD